MDFISLSDTFSLPLYVRVMLLFVLLYPALGVLVARRRLASGQGSVVVLATLPVTLGAVVFWREIFREDYSGFRIPGSFTVVSGSGEAAFPLFVACLSTCLILAGTIPYRTGDEEKRSTLLASIVIGAPFVFAAAGLIYGLVMKWLPVPPGSLAGTVLGSALVALHLLAITLRVPPESRAMAVVVFLSTTILALATWLFIHHFREEVMGL